jgi:Transposase
MELFAGIDVAQKELEVATTAGASFSLSNDAVGIAELVGRLLPLKPKLVVLEASGGYEQELLVALVTAGVSSARVNPVEVRYFARSRRYLRPSATGARARPSGYAKAARARFAPSSANWARLTMRSPSGLTARLSSRHSRCS